MHPKGNIRTLFAVLVLAISMLPLFSVIWLHARKWQVRHTMMEKLEEESLQTIRLRTGEFEWVRKGKEIRIGHRLFDTKSTLQTGDVFEFTGIYDEDEERIEAQIRRNARAGEDEKRMPLFSWHSQLFLQDSSPVPAAHWTLHLLHYRTGFTAYAGVPAPDKPAPPPKQLCIPDFMES